MYLYYDTNGNLKEFINDENLRAGNHNINFLYVYWEVASESETPYNIQTRYVRENGELYPISTTYNSSTTVVEEIPYDKNRDLKFFKYHKEYKFYKIDIPDEVLGWSAFEPLGEYDDGVSVLGNIWFSSGLSRSTMGKFAFNVERTTESVAIDTNINIAQWNELMIKYSQIAETNIANIELAQSDNNQLVAKLKNVNGDVVSQSSIDWGTHIDEDNVKVENGHLYILVNGVWQVIANLIPQEASASNKLADKLFVNTSVQSEATARASADTTLQNNINSEAGTRATNDTAIDNKLNQQVEIKRTGNDFTYNGDTVTFNKKFRNLKTGTEESKTENIGLANSTTAGMMSPSDVRQIAENKSRIAALEGQTIRLLYTTKTNPTATEIAQFVTDSGYTTNLSRVGVVISGTFHIWHYYANETPKWRDDGVDTVVQFSNTYAGIIKGSQTNGKVYAEADGTGSVYGWSDLTNKVSNTESDIDSLDTRVGTNESDIDDVSNSVSMHLNDTSNPHNVTKGQVGLGNVDNTSDVNKPISTATQTALNGKENTSNKKTSMSASPSNTNYLSELAIYNLLPKVVR